LVLDAYLGADEKIIGHTRMIHIMTDGRYEDDHHVHGRQKVTRMHGAEKGEACLEYVDCMVKVVVGIRVVA
jgi:hypothetical protein